MDLPAIAKLVAGPLIRSAFEKLGELNAPKGLVFQTTSKEVEAAIASHVQAMAEWAEEINFRDLQNPKITAHATMDLDVQLMPRAQRIDGEPATLKSSATVFVGHDHHLALLGDPGAGKTTFLKRLWLGLTQAEVAGLDRNTYPLTILLNTFNHPSATTLASSILKLFDLRYVPLPKTPDLTEEVMQQFKQRVVVTLLNATNAVLLLDGLDEISDHAMRTRIVSEVRELAKELKQCRLVITSRSAVFPYVLDNMLVRELCPLSDEQLRNFATTWFGDGKRARAFLEAIRHSPYRDSLSRPLAIGHLCAIYERTGRVPDKPKSVLRKLISLLIVDWDEQRSVERVSKYASFELDRKFDFLARFAYELTTASGGVTFDLATLQKIYLRVHQDFGLPAGDAYAVALEIESHNGIIVRNPQRQLAFAHKSFQEHLCAEHFVRLPSAELDFEQTLRLPNELAIAVSLSSDPTRLLATIFLQWLRPLKLLYTEYEETGRGVRSLALAPATLSEASERLEGIAQSGMPAFFETFFARMRVEKPDFRDDRLSGVIFLFLFTITYLDRSARRSAKLFTPQAHELVVQWLGEEAYSRCLRRVRDDYVFSIESVTAQPTGDGYVRLKRKAPVGRADAEFPESLWAKREFFFPSAT